MPGSSPGMTTAAGSPPRFSTKSCGHSFSNGRSLFSLQALLLVADAIDRAGPVVGNEDRTILVQDDIVGSAEIALVAFDPAGSEHFLLGVLAIRADDHAHDPAALVLMPVPRAVFGDED